MTKRSLSGHSVGRENATARLPRRLASSLLYVGSLAGVILAGDAFEPAVQPEDIDIEHCQTFHGNSSAPAVLDEIAAVLGFSACDKGWSAGKVTKAKQTETFRYLLAFKRPIQLGASLAGCGEIRYLKPDAAYPPDPKNEADWAKPDTPPNQSGPKLATFPVGLQTRALLLIDRSRDKSEIPFWRLFARRLYNLAPAAYPNAESEYTTVPFLSAPHTYKATDITNGVGAWINTGRDRFGLIRRAPITDVDPSWYILSWPEKQNIVGLYSRDNFVQVDICYFVGPDDVNPTVGLPKEWRRIPKLTAKRAPGRLLSFPTIKTRGLKLLILKTAEPQVAKLEALHVYTDLADAPLPVVKRTEDHPPIAISYNLEEDRKVTMVVNNAEGIRVRNLIARRERKAGENAEYWDLKDENGNYVQPGTYTWKAITHPPLQLRYEMTVYPNVTTNTPENSAWLNGPSGPGGWLADHTPPRALCIAGDRVYIGAPCAESGVSFIETDLTGRKLWGYHSFAEWVGPDFLATDGKTVFVGSTRDRTDTVWTVDIQTKSVGKLLSLATTSTRERGMVGMAARDGKLYLSVRTEDNWLRNATMAADVDILNCVPRYNEPRPPRFPHEVPPDPRDDFLRLFRLTGTPPGNNVGLVWLESSEGPGPRQHIVLAFKRPVPLGSVAFPMPPLQKDMRFRLSVLKPDAHYPPDPDDESQWTTFLRNEDEGLSAWHVAPAPENTMTRALRITFAKGEDLMGDLSEEHGADTGEKKDRALASLEEQLTDTAEGEGKSKAWKGRLEGMKLLRSRFENLFPKCTVRVNSGTVGPDGSWDAKRTRALSRSEPGIYVMEWKEPQTVRGLAIQEIDGKTTEIDVYTGPDGEAIDITAAKNWQQVATYHQALRYWYFPDKYNNAEARYMDGYVDFGREIKTRAVRLRVVEQWTSKAPDRAGCVGVRKDRGGETLDPSRCRVYGVAPLRYIGGEPPVDPLLFERIEVVDVAARKVERDIHIERPGSLSFDPAGNLYAVSGRKVVRVDLNGGEHKVFLDDVKYPGPIAFDRHGRLYLYAGEDKVIRIYGPDGKRLGSIGTPGGYKVGPWDGTRFDNVSALGVDKDDQLWVVEWHYWPKRVSLWSLDGKLKKEFLGPTCYGGAGCLDPWDKRRLFYGNLEFELDWDKGTSRLKNLTWPDGYEAGDVPIRVNGRTYLVTPKFSTYPYLDCGIVYLYEGDHLKRAAAMGVANYFKPLDTPELRDALGNRVLTDYEFLWSDLNEDGEVQASEVQFWPRRKGESALSIFDRQLGNQAGKIRYEVKRFLPSGVPVYERKELPGLWPGVKLRMSDGNFLHLEGRKKWDPAALLTPEGQVLWTYKAGCILEEADPMYPEQVVCEFGWVGHETAHAGDLGEFVVVSSNVATWNIWTGDGLLAGQIFRDMRDPKARGWSMREHERGLRLDDVSIGQEHFQGYFCRTFEDNKYYCVAGHNHASIVEVIGLDKFKRLSGQLKISGDDLLKAQAWERDQEKRRVYQRAAVIECYRLKEPPHIDGVTKDWPFVSAEMEDGAAKFRIGYDDTNLYLCYETRDMGPLKNTGNQWDRLFKTGASVDLQMSTDPGAPADRKAPVAGDFRLLLTFVDNGPIAVLYKPVVPGTAEENRWHCVSPVSHVVFDQVTRLDNVKMAATADDNGYVLEAAVPLAAIGLRPEPDLRLKLDWGILVTSQSGNEVMRRVYWANKATAMLADAPSEALLHPDLWGTVRFHDRHRTGVEAMDESLDLTKEKEAGEEKGEELEEDE